MAEGGTCSCSCSKKKSGFLKLFGFGKKKKKICKNYINCPQCVKGGAKLIAPDPIINICNEKECMLGAEPTYAVPICKVPQDRIEKMIDNNLEDFIPDNEGVLAAKYQNPRGISEIDFQQGIYIPSEHLSRCKCPHCEKKRNDESMLAMDAQVILQNSLLQSSLTDTAGLMCSIL